MIADRHFGPSEPLTWLGSFPVYLATALALGQGVFMALTAGAMALGGTALGVNPYTAPFVFSWQTAGAGAQIWQFLTYALVTPPSLWVVIQLVMLAMFGGEVEKFIGRRAFFWLYSILLLTAPLVLSVAGLVGIDSVFYGAGTANFVIFVAFAIIYPRAEIFFGIQSRWIAVIFVGIATLQGVASRDFLSTSTLWASIGAAFLFLKLDDLPSLSVPAVRRRPSKPAKRRKPAPIEKAGKISQPDDLHGSIDPILEKISIRGISSLTPAERERLERARDRLIEKEKPGV